MSRPLCTRCQRPLATCYCRWVRPHDNRVELLILQHPLEHNRPKNTAGLLHLSLKFSQFHVGEAFDPQWLSDRLTPDKHNLLLYPETPNVPSTTWGPEASCAPEKLRLIVLDGTWRKSRKILYLNPRLQRLPRLALTELPQSNYRIRKAEKPEQLSTLEASCYALTRLENGSRHYDSLLYAFDRMIEQQLTFTPATERR